MLSASYKTKHFLFQTTKLLVVIASILFIYEQLHKNNSFSELSFKAIIASKDFSMQLLLIALLFSGANWLLEFLKWKILVQSITPISYLQSVHQSLIAFSISALTPNRLGEYGIRPLFFKKTLWKKIAILTTVHHMSQLTATMLFGVFAFLFLYIRLPEIQAYSIPIISILVVVMVMLSIYFVQRKTGFIKVPFLSRALKFTMDLKQKTYLKSILLSMIRYLVFSHQFFFFLKLYGISLSYLDTMAAIGLVYFFSAILPAISIFDIFVKGGVAIFIFNLFQVEEITVIKVMGLMWIFNFVLPLIAGSFFTLKMRYPVNTEGWKLL